MRLQVGIDALAKGLRADVALDHAQHGAALLIGDRVEGLVDLRRRLDVRVDRTGRLQRVQRQRRLVFCRLVDVDLPFGVGRRERLVRHPGREAFVQPDVVPPLHRHEIAEPLVRHLVGEHRGDGLARRHRCRVRVGQQVRFAIEDRSRVFHGSRREIRDGQNVELSVRIFDGEVVVVELHHLLSGLERELRELLLVGRRADADGNAVLGALGALEVADRHGHQVRRHLRRRRELQRVRCRRRSRHI